MARTAFLGLGNMGHGMASRLIAAGHEVALYNRTLRKAEALAAPGVRVADSPSGAAVNATTASPTASFTTVSWLLRLN